jgi:hypothetical protein
VAYRPNLLAARREIDTKIQSDINRYFATLQSEAASFGVIAIASLSTHN